MSKTTEKLELFLYKNNLANKTIAELLGYLTSKTANALLGDLQILTKDVEHEVNSDNTENEIYVFTDGGCKKNGKTDAKAAYGVFFEEHHPFNKTGLVISEPTNQRAELMAILRCFEILQQELNTSEKQIVIVTDSMYAINCVTKWSKNWKVNGWKNAKGEYIKNKELIMEIVELYDNIHCKVKFQHVFSHTVAPKENDTLAYKLWYGNNMVDKLVTNTLECN